MAEPGARMAAAAGGHGRLLASHADREQVIDLLKTAFAQGRLAKDEFVARVGQALTSRTYADLATVTADIPARPAELPPSRKPAPAASPPSRKPARARTRVSMNSAITGGAFVVIVAHLGLLLALITGSAALVILVSVFIVIGAAVAVVAMVIAP